MPALGNFRPLMFLFLVVIIAPPPPTYTIQDLVLLSNAYWEILKHLRSQLQGTTGPNPREIIDEIHKYCLRYVKYLVPEPLPFKRPPSERLEVTTLRLQMYVPLCHC